MPVFYIITKPGYYEEEKLLFAMKQRDPDLLKKTYIEFLFDMMWNYIVFFLMAFTLFIFSSYFVIAHSGVYSNSSLGWISGGCISLLFYLFGFDFLIPLISALFKKFVDLNLDLK